LGLRAAIEKRAWRAVLLSLSQTLERVELDTNSVSPVTRQGGLLDTYPKSSVSLGMIRSTGRPLLNPADGSYESLVVMYSGLGSGTPYHFLKATMDLRRYDPLWGGLILATRVEMGGIRSYDPDGFVPVEERFYAGGSTSVRGWDRFLLGPLDAAGKPLGGKSLVEGSVEARFPLSTSFGATLFVDLGNVWQESFDFRFNELRYCAGAGVRLETPIGPIRFDCAVPIFEGEQSANFFFSIGQAF
jgi:outer membrane protein insertion porin family